MTNSLKLGELEIMILSAIMCVGEEAYGVRLRDEIATRTGRSVSVGAIYTTLYRLERKALVSSTRGEPTPTRGGRAKRYFRIQERGKQALYESLTALEAMTCDIRLKLSPS